MYKVLVVIDMQNDFTVGCLGNKECKENIERVNNLISTGFYNQIIATRDTHTEDYLDTLEGKNLPVKHCVKGTDGWQIYPTIEENCRKFDETNFKIIDKGTFGSVELGDYLGKICEEHPDAVIDFCGVCTGICVISNVAIAKAACKENKVRVMKDACACVTPESHEIALKAMETFQVEIV